MLPHAPKCLALFIENNDRSVQWATVTQLPFQLDRPHNEFYNNLGILNSPPSDSAIISSYINNTIDYIKLTPILIIIYVQPRSYHMFHGPKPWNEWRTLMGFQRVWALCIITLGQSNIDVEKSTCLIIHPFSCAVFHIYMSYPTVFF